MKRSDQRRPMLIATMAISIGFGAVALGACRSDTKPAVLATTAATQPAATEAPTTTAAPATTTTVAVSTTAAPAAAVPAATEAPATTVAVSEVDVADLEKQLDEIDQLLAGVDADLSQD